MERIPWAHHPSVELVEANVQDPESLARACRDVDAVYYLVHSMLSDPRRFAEADNNGARNLARAAAEAGVERIIYLGGLGEGSRAESEHLRSREEVAAVLAGGEVPVTTLRAAMVIGSGSASFEILRYLVDRLPAMTTPRWVQSLTQPIAVRDVLAYLVECLEEEATTGGTYDVGGPEVLNYLALMDIYTEGAGMRRRLIMQAPFLSPAISSYWIGMVTPVPSALARSLAEGLTSRSVVRDRTMTELVPMRLTDSTTAIRAALDPDQWLLGEDDWDVATMVDHPEWAHPGDPAWAGGTEFVDRRRVTVDVGREAAWGPVERIGEELSCCYPEGLWRLWRTWDRWACDLAGRLGLGPREGRAACALWTVVHRREGKALALRLDLGPFGEGSISYRVGDGGQGSSRIEQRVSFRPRGLAGMLYWYATLPVHQLVFDRMVRWVVGEAGARVLEGPERSLSLRAGHRA